MIGSENVERSPDTQNGSEAESPAGREMLTVTCLGRSGDVVARIDVPKGTVLLRPLEAVHFISSQCGGFGSCGACGVELADGRTVLSCFIRVVDDMTVRKRSF